jgi:hypothetical protein
MARKAFELILTTWTDGSPKQGMLTFWPAVAARWKQGGRTVIEHDESSPLLTADVVAQIESVDDEAAHMAMIDRVDAGTLRVPIAQARAAEKSRKGR